MLALPITLALGSVQGDSHATPFAHQCCIKGLNTPDNLVRQRKQLEVIPQMKQKDFNKNK